MSNKCELECLFTGKCNMYVENSQKMWHVYTYGCYCEPRQLCHSRRGWTEQMVVFHIRFATRGIIFPLLDLHCSLSTRLSSFLPFYYHPSILCWFWCYTRVLYYTGKYYNVVWPLFRHGQQLHKPLNICNLCRRSLTYYNRFWRIFCFTRLFSTVIPRSVTQHQSLKNRDQNWFNYIAFGAIPFVYS